jgi:Uma2 family endonuclease
MNTLITSEMTINLDSLLKGISDEEYYKLCEDNPDLRIEMNCQREVIIMPPTGGDTGKRNFDLAFEFGSWVRRDQSGVAFDSSTQFALPCGAKRSPDLSWVRLERWNALTAEEQKTFPPLCPDFVVELRSPSDTLKSLQEKMEEYMANGAQLGWLIDPTQKKVHVYRPGKETEILDHPTRISGEPLLRGFELDLTSILN